MDLISDLDMDFRGFPFTDVSEIEQGLGWEENKGIRTFTVVSQTAKANSVVCFFMSSPSQIGLQKKLNGSD